MNRDFVFGCAMLAVAAGYYAVSAAIPETTLSDAVGPAGLPKAYAVVLAALSIILIIGSQVQKDPAYENRESLIPGPRSPIPDPRPLRRVAGLLLIGVLYVALVPWLGYIVSLAALIAATTYYQGGRLNRQVALVAVCGALFFWVLFVVVLRIPQPSGIW